MARRAPEPVASPTRGIILVVVAIAVGFFLLRNDIDSDIQATADDDGSDTTESTGDGGGADDGGTTDEGPDDTTPDTPSVRPPSEVKVIVLNGSSISGA